MPGRFHHVQGTAYTCVAASVRMILARIGRIESEEQIQGKLAPPPFDLGRAKMYGEFHSLDFEIPICVEFLLGRVSMGWCAVEVITKSSAENASALAGPHGSGRGIVGHHVIVLIGFDGLSFDYLDPYYETRGQPLKVSLEDFIGRWWTGRMLTVR